MPTAVAASDQSVFGGHEVTMDASGSYDSEGDAMTFTWTQTAGLAVTLTGANQSVAQFEAPKVAKTETLVFQVVVSDGRLTNKTSVSVTLNVPDPNNQAPIAKVAAPDTVQSGAMLELDGSATFDTDGDSITYSWFQTQPKGPTSVLSNNDKPKALFTAPIVTEDTPFVIKLMVNDPKGGRSYAERTILVQAMTSKRPPVANPGWNQNAAAGEKVTLQGSGTDPDGDKIATYAWKQTAGPEVKLGEGAEASFVAPKVTEPVTLGFSLVVTDDKGLESSPAFVNVVVGTGAVPKVTVTKVVSLHAVTRSSIVVFFLTDVPVQASVDYGIATPGEQSTSEKEPTTRHVITISGLTPNTRYLYAMRAGTASSTGSFMTAIDYEKDPKPFTFAVVGDARAHDVWKKVAAAVLSKNPRFIVQTGDNNDSWGSAENWENYYSSGKELFANVPVFAAQGNHDTGSNYSVYNLAPQSSSSSDLYYAFVYGNAGFVAINTNGSSTTQSKWVDGALHKLTGGPLFAFHHHPLYSCGSHGSSTSMQEAFQGLFEKVKLTTDYAGHDHALIVWKPVNGVRYVVSGGGGAGLYALRGCEGPYAQSKYGFMLVTINGKAVSETLYDQDGEKLHASGTFQAAGDAPKFKDLGDWVVY